MAGSHLSSLWMWPVLAAALVLSGCDEGGEGCTPDCAGLQCGLDPVCGQECGTCQAPQTCNAEGQCVSAGCTSHQECITQHGANWFCNPLDFQCACNSGAACVGKCAGPDGCGGTCPDTCGAGQVCNPATLVCEGSGSCCPAGEVSVDGEIRLTGIDAFEVADVGALAPMGFITGTNLQPLATATCGEYGDFAIDCFDVSNVAMGLVVLADDVGFDGAAGTYFPTGNFVIAWDTEAEKVCVEDAPVHAVQNSTVVAMGGLAGFDTADGFVMGRVVDASGNPVGDALIKKADGTDLATVYYPNVFYDDFSGTSTGLQGEFMIPGPLNLQDITAERVNHTWGTFPVAAVPGHCYFVTMQAD